MPPADKARGRFTAAMDAWDVEAADGAVASLARSASAGEIADLLWPYAVRDWRNIGHKAIFTSHALRTLDLIGWEHAEPVLRSLVYGLLDGGPGGSSEPFANSLELAAGVGPGWQAGRPDAAATADLLDVLREAGPNEAAAPRPRRHRGGRGGPVALGCDPPGRRRTARCAGPSSSRCTPPPRPAACSMAFAGPAANGPDCSACSREPPGWRCFARGSGKLPPGPRIDVARAGRAAAGRSRRRSLPGSGKTAGPRPARSLAYAAAGGSPAAFFAAARRLAVTRGTDPHDFKFPAAACDDVRHASPAVRPQLLAASVYWLRDSGDPISPVVERARAALATT